MAFKKLSLVINLGRDTVQRLSMYLACGWSWIQERKSKRDSLMEEGLHENSREKFPEQQRQGFLRQNEHSVPRRRKRVAEILEGLHVRTYGNEVGWLYPGSSLSSEDWITTSVSISHLPRHSDENQSVQTDSSFWASIQWCTGVFVSE